MAQAPPPTSQELLAMLWEAMDSGQMPKVQPFYDAMKEASEGREFFVQRAEDV